MRNRLPSVRHHSQTPGEVPTPKLPKGGKVQPLPENIPPLIESWNQWREKKLRVRCATARCAWRVRGRASCSSVSPKCSPSLLPLSLSNFHSSYLSQTTVCCTNSDTFPQRNKNCTALTRSLLGHINFLYFLRRFPRNSSSCPTDVYPLRDHIYCCWPEAFTSLLSDASSLGSFGVTLND